MSDDKQPQQDVSDEKLDEAKDVEASVDRDDANKDANDNESGENLRTENEQSQPEPETVHEAPDNTDQEVLEKTYVVGGKHGDDFDHRDNLRNLVQEAINLGFRVVGHPEHVKSEQHDHGIPDRPKFNTHMHYRVKVVPAELTGEDDDTNASKTLAPSDMPNSDGKGVRTHEDVERDREAESKSK